MAELWELNWSRLPLETCMNTRELGGYPTADGGSTKYHRFVRSGSLTHSLPEEREFLYKYGVRCTIDLRGDYEHEHMPEPMIAPDVETHHVPLYEVNIADIEQVDFETVFEEADPTITEVYRRILEKSKDGIARVFKIIAAAPEGCVLFNCTIGKDRTGVIAFLLMMLAGANKYDCIASYRLSDVYLRFYPIMRKLMAEKGGSPNQRTGLYSTFETGEFLYNFIVDECGGAENYLLAAGVSPEELEAVRKRLVG